MMIGGDQNEKPLSENQVNRINRDALILWVIAIVLVIIGAIVKSNGFDFGLGIIILGGVSAFWASIRTFMR